MSRKKKDYSAKWITDFAEPPQQQKQVGWIERACVWVHACLTTTTLCAGGALHTRRNSFTLCKMEVGVRSSLHWLLRKLGDGADCRKQRLFQL